MKKIFGISKLLGVMSVVGALSLIVTSFAEESKVRITALPMILCGLHFQNNTNNLQHCDMFRGDGEELSGVYLQAYSWQDFYIPFEGRSFGWSIKVKCFDKVTEELSAETVVRIHCLNN